MKIPLLKSNSAYVEASKAESTLADWLRAMTNFQSNYDQLITCINHSRIRQELTPRNTDYIGQCPVTSLLELTSLMQEELKKLSQDIDYPALFRQSAITQHYQKLKVHTRVLNRLNHQAKNWLYLVTLPSL